MLVRPVDQQEKKEFEASPGYQFYQQINSILPDCQRILKADKVMGLFTIKDDFDQARQAFTRLSAELETLYRIVLTEEENREQYRAPAQLISDQSDAEKAYAKATEDLNLLKIRLVSEREKLAQEEDRLSNDIRAKKLEIGSIQGEQIVKDNLTANKLSAEKKDLDRRVAKFQSKCCLSKKQSQEMAEAEDRLESIKREIRDLETDRSPADTRLEEIDKLRVRLENVRSQLSQHENDQSLIDAAEKQITNARIAHERIKVRLKEHEARYYAAQSKLAISGFVRTYVALSLFKVEIDSIYIKNQTTGVAKKSDIAKFIEMLVVVKDRCDELVDIIWSPAYENRSAKQLFDRLSPADRVAIFDKKLSYVFDRETSSSSLVRESSSGSSVRLYKKLSLRESAASVPVGEVNKPSNKK